jgi:AcrR family transcriptional regulator
MLDLSKLNLPRKQLQILKTGLDLFQRFGIKRVTIEEICQTANVSKMTFYKYFKNKNELVRFIWEKGVEQAVEKFEAKI